jgi:hypothetical protein
MKVDVRRALIAAPILFLEASLEDQDFPGVG